MRIRLVSLVLVILLGSLLTGCWTDRWIEVTSGEYAPVRSTGGSEAASAIKTVRVNRENQMAWFMLADGSQVAVPFTSRPRAEWPAGCPTNVHSTRMEVLELVMETLTIASATFSYPILVRDCPPDPEEIVLRSDGEIGGGGAACVGAAECITFEIASGIP